MQSLLQPLSHWRFFSLRWRMHPFYSVGYDESAWCLTSRWASITRIVDPQPREIHCPTNSACSHKTLQVLKVSGMPRTSFRQQKRSTSQPKWPTCPSSRFSSASMKASGASPPSGTVTTIRHTASLKPSRFLNGSPMSHIAPRLSVDPIREYSKFSAPSTTSASGSVGTGISRTSTGYSACRWARRASYDFAGLLRPSSSVSPSKRKPARSI